MNITLIISDDLLAFGLSPDSTSKAKKENKQMNKMIKMATMVACAAMMLGIVGCGVSSPEGVAQKFVTYMKNGDVKGMSSCCAEENAELGLRLFFAGKNPEEFKKMSADKKFEIGEVKISGDNATVPVKIDGNDVGELELKKVDGTWKVTLK